MYLSDTNLRAVLTVLVTRAGGTIEITNEELYDAMLPDGGREGFVLTEIANGVRLSVRPSTEDYGDSGASKATS